MEHTVDSESASIAASGLLAKLFPPALAAFIVALVDPPQNKRELFLRVLVGLVFSYQFSHVGMDFLHQFSLFTFLDWNRDDHRVAIESVLGASGWFVVGAATMLFKKFQADPIGTVDAVKKEIP